MEPEDLLSKRPRGPLADLAAEDLDPLSVAELDERIARLEAEIERSRAKRAKASAFRAAADGLFKR